MHVVIYHIDNDGDNYPSSFSSMGRPKGRWSIWQTSRSLKSARVCGNMYIFFQLICQLLHDQIIVWPPAGRKCRANKQTNQNSSSWPAATPGCLSGWLALQCVDDSAEATDNKVVTVVSQRPPQSSIWLFSIKNKLKKIGGKKRNSTHICRECKPRPLGTDTNSAPVLQK